MSELGSSAPLPIHNITRSCKDTLECFLSVSANGEESTNAMLQEVVWSLSLDGERVWLICADLDLLESRRGKEAGNQTQQVRGMDVCTPYVRRYETFPRI